MSAPADARRRLSESAVSARQQQYPKYLYQNPPQPPAHQKGRLNAFRRPLSIQKNTQRIRSVSNLKTGHTGRTISRVLSGTVIPLGASLLIRSSNLPERSASNVKAFCLVLLRMGFSLLHIVTKCTVRSYRTFSPLPVPPEGGHRRSCFLLHFPSRYRARPLAGILLCGARTFLPVPHMRHAATVCPTCMKCGL